MTVKLRMARGGSKKRPFYRIVAADERSPRDGRYIEKLGHHNPLLPKGHSERYSIDDERVKYWLGTGAQPTDRTQRLFVEAGLMEARPIPTQTKQHLPKAKTLARLQEAAEAKKAAAEAVASAAEAEVEVEAAVEAEATAEVEVEAEAEAEVEVESEAEAEIVVEATKDS